MFGQDDNNEQKQDDSTDTSQVGHVTAPVNPVTDDDSGLGEDTSDNSATTAPSVTSTSSSFYMDPVPGSSPSTAASQVVTPSADDDLLKIKQDALQHLSPLVGHLDQAPEEKFRTLMMMIQASDDQTKLKEAYDVAKQITDEKVRAQALLDVVNEINYFTQQNKQ